MQGLAGHGEDLRFYVVTMAVKWRTKIRGDRSSKQEEATQKAATEASWGVKQGWHSGLLQNDLQEIMPP